MLLNFICLIYFSKSVLGRAADFSSYPTEETSAFINSSEEHFSNLIGQIQTKSENYSIDFKDSVKFLLYTKKNKDSYQQLFLNDLKRIKSSNYDPRQPTSFVIHGYMDDVTAEIVQSIKNRFLGRMNSNVVAVDWSVLAKNIFYVVSAQQTPSVGTYIGSFVNFLIDNGDKAANIHIIGHSLGAQAAGFAGKAVKSGKVKRITGLDPALPGFEIADKNHRIDAEDADFVDCIHTCGGFLGFLNPICQADYYPNGGRNVQPGCLWADFGVCSHSRSHEYFAESILSNHKFPSSKCKTVPADDNPTSCIYSDALMGYPASKKYKGIFFTRTNSAYPFSKDIEI
ncbi:pancreatic triacylglycerol lipase-like isoform X1 [Rhodnius prolixus]|uniref:pancreatic triacylglycerol lipase-like isoform X1 n=2 Tax=Rhodnius prolixus TaxID=13249 RepID=UPI003D18D696